MAGGYENEDRQAEMEELRREKEREARERMEKARRDLMADAASTPDPALARAFKSARSLDEAVRPAGPSAGARRGVDGRKKA